jgi:non-ribosomal peptide synthetase component E (peptide arylation enzyme)
MNISEALFRNAYYSPQQLAIVDCRRSLTYSEFHQRVNRLSHYLFKSVRAQIETSRSNLPTSKKDYVPARLYNEIAEHQERIF